jgi:RNA polymerase sigma-70 factor (ECF subfamily)
VRAIAVNAAIDFARRKRPESPVEDQPARGGGEKRQEDLDLLRKALAALSPTDREILLARELEGAPDDLIARRLGLSLTGVRVRVHRARVRLRRRFQEVRP